MRFSLRRRAFIELSGDSGIIMICNVKGEYLNPCNEAVLCLSDVLYTNGGARN